MVVLGHSSVHGQLSVDVTHTALYVVATAGVVVKLIHIWLHKIGCIPTAIVYVLGTWCMCSKWLAECMMPTQLLSKCVLAELSVQSVETAN